MYLNLSFLQWFTWSGATTEQQKKNFAPAEGKAPNSTVYFLLEGYFFRTFYQENGSMTHCLPIQLTLRLLISLETRHSE